MRRVILTLVVMLLALPITACQELQLGGEGPQVSVQQAAGKTVAIVNPGQEIEKILLLPFKDGLSPIQVGQCREKAFDAFQAVVRVQNFGDALKSYASLPAEQQLDVRLRTTTDLTGRGRDVCIVDRTATTDDVHLKHVLGNLNQIQVLPAWQVRLDEMRLFSRLVSAEALQRLGYDQAVMAFARLDPSAQTRVINELTSKLSANLKR